MWPLYSQEVAAPQSAAGASKKGGADLLPIRAYLDQTVVPLLISALSELAKERYSLYTKWIVRQILWSSWRTIYWSTTQKRRLLNTATLCLVTLLLILLTLSILVRCT